MSCINSITQSNVFKENKRVNNLSCSISCDLRSWQQTSTRWHVNDSTTLPAWRQQRKPCKRYKNTEMMSVSEVWCDQYRSLPFAHVGQNNTSHLKSKVFLIITHIRQQDEYFELLRSSLSISKVEKCNWHNLVKTEADFPLWKAHYYSHEMVS